MIIPPKYNLSVKTISLISKIDSLKLFFKTLQLPNSLKTKLNRQSLLKSSLFSAKIEGNPLRLDNLDNQSETIHKKEIFNILSAYKYINNQISKKTLITKDLIITIHSLVLKNISSQKGRFRNKASTIFNQSGIAVYVPPPPQKINRLINRFLDYLNKDQEEFPLVKALIGQLIFEKIHPFLDGNGRVGRLLVFAVLRSKGYEMDILTSFEEELEKKKDDYYFKLDNGLKKPEDYLNFMLSCFYKSFLKLKDQIEVELKQNKISINLFPRQQEILNIIKDHQLVSFDFIKRRFLRVPKRTLRYDLKKLVDKGLVIKIGKTKGVLYKPGV